MTAADRALSYLVELAVFEKGNGQVAIVLLIKDDTLQDGLQQQLDLLGPILAQPPSRQVGQEEGALGQQHARLVLGARQQLDQEARKGLAGRRLCPPVAAS